jgi:hypothetical protein
MKNIIDNLKEEACYWAIQNCDPELNEYEWSKAIDDKFAELIIQEAISYVNSRTKDWDAKLQWIFNDESGYMNVDLDSLLKEHFGMENKKFDTIMYDSGLTAQGGWDTMDTYQQEAVMKCFELIVKECSEVADDNFDSGFCPVGDYIKRHFNIGEDK